MTMPENVFSETSVDSSPFKQFEKWYREKISLNGSVQESVSLGTSSKNGRVSVRTVLLKEFDEKGFIFFTNYKSKKGKQLNENAYAAMLFYWPEMNRQIRIEGVIKKIPAHNSDSYFNTRPPESQLSAWASEQSTEIPGRQYLETRFNYYKNLFAGKKIDRPPQWGGLILIPDWFEFWQEGNHRMHDRIIYSCEKDGWHISRLAP